MRPTSAAPTRSPPYACGSSTTPAVRRCPFTTGILVGIGETPRERVQSILDIRHVAREYGHVQEVIVQNFRAKPDTAMRGDDDLALDDYLATIAVARLLLGPRMRVQAPPNLTDIGEVAQLLRAGVDDWGGVSPLTPDHVNPERPWPHLDDLTRLTAEAGFVLRERLTAHPEYVTRADPWIDPRVRAHVAALADPAGLAVEGRHPSGQAWQEPDTGYDAFATATREDAPTCTRRSTPRAAPTTVAATSTRSTATGPRSGSTRATSSAGRPSRSSRRSSASTPTCVPGLPWRRTTPPRWRTPTTPPSRWRS